MNATRGGPAPLTVHFARELKILLTSRDMNATELARRIGKNQAWIQRRMAGDVAFDLEDLEKIAAVFEIGPLELLSLVGSGTTLRYHPAAVSRPPNRPGGGSASGPGRTSRLRQYSAA